MLVPEITEISLRTLTGSVWTSYLWRLLAILVMTPLLAHWTWVLLAPSGLSVLPAVIPVPTRHAEKLFGSAASISAAMPVMPEVRVIGVFAGIPGFAVLELDGKRQIGLATGHELSPGVKLVEVAKDHVMIERGSVRQRVDMTWKSSGVKPLDAQH